MHIIGAGPGDPELLTVKAKRIIDLSDVIIYADSLVNPEVFQDSRADKIIKTSTMNIDEINETVKKYYDDGKEIARLHSGDPSVYGAINDEMQFFRENGMEFEIIPGISSVFAAAASLGLELTAPGTTQSVILTRVPRRTEHFEKEDLELLAEHKTSLAIFLSASNARKVSEKLINAGYSPEDRAIIAYRVSWPDEKMIMSTIGNLEHAMFENRINRQALIMVGGNISYYSNKKSYLYNPDFTHLFRKSSKKD
ncbi:MAG: precorrin-4 C(11)-methyltransferase [Ferroplasma sp.]|uniref:precorrin-4 C(11)-methyltransferase n=1 Tax=Ferroplasma sp. TaxID=2591003 RepID=UPI002815944D|nr:precorrin-4 C(11)-methyltransferase [Ferroplasma sp.]WMT52281.1 MAG: precorrin-4 C(11)-methyltransferase [Ferroplasma sp.]